MTTTAEILAMASRLDDTKIRFASEDERKATMRRNAATDEAAALLRKLAEEREAIDRWPSDMSAINFRRLGRVL